MPKTKCSWTKKVKVNCSPFDINRCGFMIPHIPNKKAFWKWSVGMLLRVFLAVPCTSSMDSNRWLVMEFSRTGDAWLQAVHLISPQKEDFCVKLCIRNKSDRLKLLVNDTFMIKNDQKQGFHLGLVHPGLFQTSRVNFVLFWISASRFQVTLETIWFFSKAFQKACWNLQTIHSFNLSKFLGQTSGALFKLPLLHQSIQSPEVVSISSHFLQPPI